MSWIGEEWAFLMQIMQKTVWRGGAKGMWFGEGLAIVLANACNKGSAQFTTVMEPAGCKTGHPPD